jgi:hypothetical protein
MLTYTDIETDIAKRLSEVFVPVGVRVETTANAAIERKPADGARVIVTYIGSSFEAPANNIAMQNETATFEVYVDVRNVNDRRTGAYAILTAVKQRLIGFRPVYGTPMTATKTNIVIDERYNNLGWSSQFTTDLVNVADLTDDIIMTLQQVLINEPEVDFAAPIPPQPTVPPTP